MRLIIGSVLMGQGRLPSLSVSVPDGSTRDGSHGPGHHEIRLVEKADSPRVLDPALPSGSREARLPARCHPRPSYCLSVSTVRSLHRDVPPLMGISHHSKFFVRHGHSLNQFASLICFAFSLCPMDMSQFLLTDLDVYTKGFVSSFG